MIDFVEAITFRVIPAKAGIQIHRELLDSRFHGNDRGGVSHRDSVSRKS